MIREVGIQRLDVGEGDGVALDIEFDIPRRHVIRQCSLEARRRKAQVDVAQRDGIFDDAHIPLHVPDDHIGRLEGRRFHAELPDAKCDGDAIGMRRNEARDAGVDVTEFHRLAQRRSDTLHPES